MKIKKTILIEDLTEQYPFSVNYLAKKGIRCIVCGEPIWRTLEEAAAEKGFDIKTIDTFIKDLNKLNDDFKKQIEDSINKINPSKFEV